MHDPADLTPEVMYQALQHYIFDQLEGGGVYDMDVQPLLSHGFEVSWFGTAGATQSTLHLVFSVVECRLGMVSQSAMQSLTCCCWIWATMTSTRVHVLMSSS